MAVTRLENGELHVNVLLLPRDRKQRTGSVLGQAHLPSGRAYIFCDRLLRWRACRRPFQPRSPT